MQISIDTKYLSIPFWVCLSMLWMACEKVPPSRPNAVPGDSLSNGMLIGSEGNFQWGNASLSFWDHTKNMVYEDVYRTVNNKPLGDVLQSITVYKDKIYLVLNNSGKITVIHKQNFKEVGTILGFKSPRYILPISDDKAYVSDLYDNHLAIVNLGSMQVSGKIACAGWTEEMILVNQKVFVCNKYSSYVYVLNTQTDKVEDSLNIGYGAISMVQDKQQKLWVLTTGNNTATPKVAAAIQCINPITQTIEKTYTIGIDKLPLKLCINEAKDKIFWIENHVWSKSVLDTIMPKDPLIAANGRVFYGLGFDTYKQQLLVSDAKDYVQKSEVLVYDEKGTFIKSFRAGINTSSFSTK